MVTIECNECGNRFRVNQYDIDYGDITCPLCLSHDCSEIFDYGYPWNEDLHPGEYGCTGEYGESGEWAGCDGNTWSE